MIWERLNWLYHQVPFLNVNCCNLPSLSCRKLLIFCKITWKCFSHPTAELNSALAWVTVVWGLFYMKLHFILSDFFTVQSANQRNGRNVFLSRVIQKGLLLYKWWPHQMPSFPVCNLLWIISRNLLEKTKIKPVSSVTTNCPVLGAGLPWEKYDYSLMGRVSPRSMWGYDILSAGQRGGPPHRRESLMGAPFWRSEKNNIEHTEWVTHQQD